MALDIAKIINVPISSNCYIICDKSVNDKCLIVDPGSETNEILYGELDNLHVEPQYIILTHEHFDHCWGVNDLIQKYDIPIICSELCSRVIMSAKKNCSLFYNQVGFEINANAITTESIKFVMKWNNYNLSFLSTPGHSDASICFYVEKKLFTGDTLIKNEKTVTKLLSGSKEKLEHTIQKLKNICGLGFVVYPGHGESFLLDKYDILKSLK